MGNETAAGVLDAYLDARSLAVPHAILVEGGWGSGKSHFLREIYEPARRQRLASSRQAHVPFLFVSLFGATSAQDVEMRIYKAACPGEAIAGAIAGTIALGVGEFFRVKDATKGAVEKLGAKAIKRLNEFVFVFDDLERIEPKAFGEVMGLANSLVAEHGRRVILVADEAKLEQLVTGAVWKDQNEKVVGRRAKIEPDLESVIRNSISSLPKGRTKDLMQEHFDDLLTTAETSKVHNLRSLRWAIHNAAAFSDAIVEDDDIPGEHTVRTICVVLATTLWIRSRLLSSEDLEKVPGLSQALAFQSFGNSKEPYPKGDDPLKQAKSFMETFAVLSVDSPPVDYGFIKGFEDSGVLDADEMNLWIKSQFGYGSKYTEPSWRKLWSSHERPRKATEEAVTALADELSRRVYTDAGIILHAAGLAVRQSSWLDPRLTGGEDVVPFFKRYIDDIAGRGLLHKNKFDTLVVETDSYGGLGFCASYTDDFKEIAAYAKSRSQEVATLDLISRAEAVFEKAEAGDPEALFDLVRSDDYELSTEPVLMHLPPERLSSLMARDVPELHAGSRLLAYRYHEARDGKPLSQEIGWARKVYENVVKELSAWDEPYRTAGLASMRGMIRHYEKDKLPDDMIIPPEKTQ